MNSLGEKKMIFIESLRFYFLFLFIWQNFDTPNVNFYFPTKKSLRNSVLFILVWMAWCYACVGDVPAWVLWVACLCGSQASVSGMCCVLACLTCEWHECEWHVLRACVADVLVWEASVVLWREWRGWCACVGDVPAWASWVASLCGWRVCVDDMLARVTC